jgi:chromosome partitioning protein
MKRVVFNQKGGVGKTTIVCNLAAVAAARGYRTLVVDLDVQGNATRYLLGDGPFQPETTIADFFEGALTFSLTSPPFEGFATETQWENLDVVASSPELEHLQVKLETKQKVYKLRQALLKLRSYDMVFLDTPPALNFYSRSALIASDRVLIPFDCDDFARQALYTLLDNIAEIRADHNDELAIEGIIVNQFQGRAKLPQRMVDQLRTDGQTILEPLLSASVKVRESHERAQPLPFLLPSHKTAREYEALFDRLDTADLR